MKKTRKGKLKQPSSATGQLTTDSIEAAFADLRAGNVEMAAAAVKRILAIQPQHHGALNLSALCALHFGEMAEAVSQLKQAVTLKPNEAIYHCNLAAAYKQSHRYSDAIVACHKALALRPDYLAAISTLGATHFAAEQYDEALSVYERGCALAPDQPLMHAYRADTLRELGRVRAALAEYELALSLNPNLAHVVGNLGRTLLAVGETERALELCRRATELSSDNWVMWMNLGKSQHILGRLEEAMEAYSSAYELEANSALLCTEIGEVWQEISDLEQAIAWYEKALAVEPERADTRCALAAVTLDAGNVSEAIMSYRKILDEHPEHFQAHSGLGMALWEDGDAEEAIRQYQKAAALQPENASTHAQLATILASAGDVKAANACNREALAINPNCVPALTNLAQNLRGKLPEKDADHMTHLTQKAWVRAGAQAVLHFGLAHYWDGCKNYSKAADHAKEANAQHTEHKRERGWNYDPIEYERHVERLMNQFTSEFFARTQGLGDPTETPVFVVGMPRSGTTLTEQILASHPRIFGVGERNFASQTFNRLPELMQRPTGTQSLDCLDQLSTDSVRASTDWHLARLQELTLKAGLKAGDVDRIVDKMPDNYNMLGWLVTAFPNAKIIYCRRDVRDVATSCWMTQFKEIRWAFDLSHIAERIRQHQRLMAHWRKVLPTTILEVDYEETVSNQAAQTSRMLNFVGLPWDDACLQFHKTERLVRTASVTQVRQPIYKRSVERWRRYEETLKPLIESLGLE